MTGSHQNLTEPDIETSRGFCRNCLLVLKSETQATSEKRCPNCRSPRLLIHPEWWRLSIAHIDCDAFYAAVEKRDRPELANKAVIIGGEHRGVVSTACYKARIHGVHSAMPIFEAKKRCPDAIIIKPNMALYNRVGRDIRDMMSALTPLVQPLSIDEAFLDLTGTEKLHHAPPALTLAKLVQNIEKEIKITVSVGLSHNKFLAKLASDLDKPRGFSVIGVEETMQRIAPMPVSKIWGVGKASQERLARDGITLIGQIQSIPIHDMARRYESSGLRLAELSRGIDRRRIDPSRETKSISSETTFDKDIKDIETLRKHLWQLSQKTAKRCKRQGLAGKTIILKAKTDRFTTLTRSQTRHSPTQLAEAIYEDGQILLKQLLLDLPNDYFRLIGIGLSQIVTADQSDIPDLAEPERHKKITTERTIDKVREKFGDNSIRKGRDLI